MNDFTFDTIEDRAGLVAVFSHGTMIRYQYRYSSLYGSEGRPVAETYNRSAFNLQSLETRIRNLEAIDVDVSEERRGLVALLIALANQAEAQGDDQRWSELQDRISEVKSGVRTTIEK